MWVQRPHRGKQDKKTRLLRSKKTGTRRGKRQRGKAEAIKGLERARDNLTPTAHSPGETLPGSTAVAFFEATQGSHTVIGDKLHHNGEEVATLIGYEMNHMPNHMNIVFTANGEYPEFKLGDQIKIL